MSLVIYIYIYIYIYDTIDIWMCLWVGMRTCIYVCMYTRVCRYVWLWADKRYAHLYVYIYVCPGLHVNAHKTEYMCFNQTSDISTQDGSSLKLVDKLTYLGSCVSSMEKDIDTRLTKVWTAIDKLSIIWKPDLTDKMKRSFFQAAVVSILLYGCTSWTLTKRLEKKLDGNYTRMLQAILNKSWRQHSTIRLPTSHHENYPS